MAATKATGIANADGYPPRQAHRHQSTDATHARATPRKPLKLFIPNKPQTAARIHLEAVGCAVRVELSFQVAPGGSPGVK